MKLIKKIIDANGNQIKFPFDNYNYWPEDLNTFTFYDFYENIVQLKHNEIFKKFDEQTNSWKYFKFFIKDGRHFYIPIEYWFTKKNILTYITYIAIFISILSFIISFYSL